MPKDYARPDFDEQGLGELISPIGTIGFGEKGKAARPTRWLFEAGQGATS
jgi:hypothetical protein